MCESTSDTTIYNDPNFAIKSFTGIHLLLYQEKFCDVEIIGSDQNRYPVHGVIMASFSDLFKDSYNFPRNSENRIEITINGIEDRIIRKIIEFCYTGKIDVTYNNLLNIIHASGILQISYVLDVTKDLIKRLIDIHNCCQILDLAKKYHFVDLEEYASNFIQFNFSEINSTKEFLEIDQELLIDIIKYEDLNISSEVEVFRWIKQWISHNTKERSQYIHTLMKHVKLPLLPIEVLFDEVQPFCQIDNCSKLVLDAIQWQTLPSRRPDLESNKTKQRNAGSYLLIVGDWFKPVSSAVLMYNPKTKLCSEFINLNTNLCNFSCEILGDNLIIIGGFIDNTPNYQNLVECYNLKTDVKSNLPNMLEKRNRPSVAVMNEVLYVAGGCTEHQPLKSMERFDFKSNTWKYVESMPTARNECASVVFENEFYVIGGSSSIRSDAISNVEAYCPRTGKWRTCEPMNLPRICTTAAVLKGFIYVVGGLATQALPSAERYNPILKTWTLIANINSPRYGIALNRIGNNLIALGGSDGAKTLSVAEEYDPSKNQWKPLTLTTNRGHTSALAISRSHLKRLKPNLVTN